MNSINTYYANYVFRKLYIIIFTYLYISILAYYRNYII